jgi:hypothetical protein
VILQPIRCFLGHCIESRAFDVLGLGSVLCGAIYILYILAYNDVRDDKKPTTWLLLDYVSDKSDKLTLAGTGDGGLTELKESGLLKHDAASFAYVRVVSCYEAEEQNQAILTHTAFPRNMPMIRSLSGRSLSSSRSCTFGSFPFASLKMGPDL